jgi:hypothetical protein
MWGMANINTASMIAVIDAGFTKVSGVRSWQTSGSLTTGRLRRTTDFPAVASSVKAYAAP